MPRLSNKRAKQSSNRANPKIAPYGSWKSPITSELIVAGSVRLSGLAVQEQTVYWTEGRPQEGGRNVVVQRTRDGLTHDLTVAPFNVRTRVHEYGGLSYAVAENTLYFSNFADQRIYRRDAGGATEPITPEAALRYADLQIDRQRDVIFCIREDHTVAGQEPANALVCLSTRANGDRSRVLAGGNDFYASPRLSPDGTLLAWLTWHHPNMPWDGTELWVAEVQPDGALGQAELVAGGVSESIFQPEWSPDGLLHFVSDRSGWWNLYRWRGGRVETILEMAAEFGLPQWAFGMRTYAFEAADRIICAYGQGGIWRLARLHTETGQLQPFSLPYTAVSDVHVAAGFAICLAGSATEATAVVRLDLRTGAHTGLRRSSDLDLDPGYISTAQAIEFPTEGDLTAHAFYYPPTNRDFRGRKGEKPPLIVHSHGGPTGAASSTLNLNTQFWTSRGFAVVDVNYGGSTGYGRVYRERLKGQWGIVDVDDCVNAACYLVARGAVDSKRLAIAGGSAGGYTTLAALTFRDVFSAGASHFGVSDLETLATDTHKLESRYLDGLIGPYPERRDIYVERSPIHHTDLLACALILFQGLEDKVVPPSQAEKMHQAVLAKGMPVAYVPFEGEQHGFRRAENIKRALDGELYFYAQVFGFKLADPVDPVAIGNLEIRG